MRQAALKEHLFLIGPTGVGKTRLSKALAKALQVPALDIDTAIIETEGQDIANIFYYHGEAHFRKAERRALCAAAAKPPQVIATGAGIVLDADNRTLMMRTGTIAYLAARPEILLARLAAHDNRPLLGKSLADKEAALTDMARIRTPLYEGLADIHLDGETTALPDLVASICRHVTKRTA